VAVYGNMAAQGDHGQGILIVLGDLDITGKFFYSGIVVVTGKTFIRGSGGESRIDGALVSLGDVALCEEDNSGSNSCGTDPTGTGDTGEGTEFLGNAKIMYNACMVSAAEQAFANAVTANPPAGHHHRPYLRLVRGGALTGRRTGGVLRNIGQAAAIRGGLPARLRSACSALATL
jgi:hypothetical protein